MGRMEDLSDADDAKNNMKQKVRDKERQEAKEKIILEEMRREEKMKRAYFEEQMYGPGREAREDQSSRSFRDPFMGGGTNRGQTFGDKDPFSSGMNREDPGDLGSYARAWQQEREDPGARMNRDRMHSVKHGIQRKPRISFGEVLVYAIIISF